MSEAASDVRTRLLAIFRTEAEEHLQAIAAALETLHGACAADELDGMTERLFREMHTLKGAARSVGRRDIEALGQAAESLLSRMRRAHAPFSTDVLETLVAVNETVTQMLAGTADPAALPSLMTRLRDEVPAGSADAPAETTHVPDRAPVTGAPPSAADAPAPAAPAPPPARAFETMRLALGGLDRLQTAIEELFTVKLTARRRLEEARALSAALEGRRQQRHAPAPGGGADGAAGLRDPAWVPVVARARELVAHLSDDERTITKTADALDGQMRRLRMTSASGVLDLFPDMVADLAAARGKLVDWVADGAHLEVDRRVLEAMKEPLIHLIRNAVDHGIEPPAVRARDGKPPRGRVALRVAVLEDGRIEIDVTDDGAGIDLEAVRAAAVRASLLGANAAQQLSEEAAFDLIYRSGVSTSAGITLVSGRGLGLPIVREQVERLGGQIHIDTRPGAGTGVHLTLPASIAAFSGLLVRAGTEQFLLPIAAVERTIRVTAGTAQLVDGRPVIPYRGAPVPVVRLATLLGLPAGPEGAAGRGARLCIIVCIESDRLALEVDEVVGTREALVKQFGPPVVRLRNVAAAGLLGSGRIALILHPADLLRSAVGAVALSPTVPDEEAPTRSAVILVVDDSITTRTMEKNLLEAAGYQVHVAADGVEAWTLLKSEPVDLVVSDVDMPRLDGFDLTARIRADPELAQLPVVLVTVLESRENKERGIAVGANAYVVKSSFEQSNLLEIIHRLV